MTTPPTTQCNAANAGAAGWLGLAASPTFALMAWLAANDAPRMALCAAPGMAPMHGMAGMYLLMSLFHAAPWLHRAAGRWQVLVNPATQTEGD